MRIRVDGTLPLGTTAKDLVLMIIGRIGAQGARGYVVEFCGSAIDALSIEARFTLCNMTVEAGARGALIAPDAEGHRLRAGARAGHRRRSMRDAALAHWATLHSDDERASSTSSTASTPATWRRTSPGAPAPTR